MSCVARCIEVLTDAPLFSQNFNGREAFLEVIERLKDVCLAKNWM